MRAPLLSRLSPVVLLLWMAPSAGALAVGVHIALDHRGAHDAERQREISELARAATHGHHHDVDVGPHHEHDARLGGVAQVPRRGPSPIAAFPSLGAVTGALAGRTRPDNIPRRAPPAPLFAAHCSLLL